MIKTMEEAREIVLEKIPRTRVESMNEMDDCFVINLVPIGYCKANGIFVGGAIRVDKKSGELSGYNPMTEGHWIREYL